MAADPKSDRKSVSVEMVKSSKVDPSCKTNDANLPAKDGVMSDAVSCVSSVDAVGSIKGSDLDQESLMSEQSMYYPAGSYYGYYYPGFDNTYMEWSDSNYFVQPSGLEAQQALVQSDGGQVMYFAPGFQTGYTHYGAYVPGTMVGVDGNYMYQQPYVLSPVVPQTPGSPAYITSPIGYGSEMVPAYSWDSSFWDGYGVSGFYGTPSTPSQKTKSFQKTQHSKNNNQNSKLNVMVALSVDVPNQPLKSFNKSHNLSKGYYPAIKPSYAPQGSPGILYRSTPVNAQEASRNWYDADKTKARNKTNNTANFDLLTDQNRGPRIDNLKTSWSSAADQTRAPVGTDDICGNKTVVIRRDDYNLPDFPLNYEHAMFFVIKSYSEDDIHKSIKYNVWASTPNGNKRLDSAFQVAQDKMAEKGSKCPIFLFFSVNASGQFCGVAEMIGPVNFNKNMDFWQQDKWNGFFSVRWHMIKDVPNPQFRHIILENNDNKPVTNSRDTQEVKFSQGIEMLSIFKNFSSRTSILDDFGFYENRQKVMLEKRGRFSVPTGEQFLPKADEAVQVGKPEDAAPTASSLDTLELDLKSLDLHAKSDELPVAVAID